MPAVIYAVGFPRWKMPIVRQCFAGRDVEFIDQERAVPEGAWVVLWGMSRMPQGVVPGGQVLRLEDGFLRSVGLGADLVRPVSWALDRSGMYYDATHPSDLEKILASVEFDPEHLQRAAQLREKIVAAGITKYNVGSANSWRRPADAAKVILVPGQVESDASLRFGNLTVAGNIALLQQVRRQNPGGYILYKPHPDVLARLRLPGQNESEAKSWCDEVVTEVSLASLFEAIDEVHVLTSLSGFEALLRGIPVHCYGQPFYAGWGLTHDQTHNSRRIRRLTLDELVAGCLIQYPLYLSRDGRNLISPEEALQALIEWRESLGGRNPWWRNSARVVLRWFSEVGRAP